MSPRELIVKEPSRALWYEDGKLIRELDAGHYPYPKRKLFGRNPVIEVRLVDMREQELTIKGQEILTADKVSLRVSILVQFRVTNAQAAVQEVANYEERVYSDVQLAARRSLASMSLDTILTNRNQLSEDILADVREVAAGYGITIRRADVKDLVFPGNLQEIMNRVLAAQRQSEATLVQAKAQAEVERIQAETQAHVRRTQAVAEIDVERQRHEMEREALRQTAALETQVTEQRERTAELLDRHPGMLRLLELEAYRELSKHPQARVYLGLDRPRAAANIDDKGDDRSTE